MKITFAALAFLLTFSPAFSQNGAHTLLASGPCSPIIPILCPSGVENPNNAVDNDLTTYANMRTSIGLLSSSFLKMGFSTPAPGGYTVGIFTDQSTVLDVDVLASLTITLYSSTNQQISQKVGFALADVQVDEQNRGIIRIKVPKNKTAASVQLTVGGLLLLENDVKVYGAVYAPNNAAYYADYVYAEGPCDPIVPVICPGGILNSGNAVDASKTNFATATIPLGVGGNAYLDLGFTQPGTKGDAVYFTLGTSSLPLGVSLLANLDLKVYDQNGNVVKEKNGFALADAQILDANKFLLHVKTKATGNYSIARARITLTSLVSLLTDVQVYNAYYKGKVDFASYFRVGDMSESASSFSNLNVYPNPASNSITVMLKNESTSTATMEITNLMGQTVYADQLQPESANTVNTEKFDNGIYMIRVSEDGQVFTKKFIIER